MFKFINNLFQKYKSKKILNYIKSIESSYSFFEKIAPPPSDIAILTAELSKNSLYHDIVSRYNVCLQKIDNHNQDIQTLTFSLNSLIETHPVYKLIENIDTIKEEKIQDIYNIIRKVYSYQFSDSFPSKIKYDNYKQEIEALLQNYNLIKEQKNLILSIHREIENLPDHYIVEEDSASALKDIISLTEKFSSYSPKYFPTPIVNTDTIKKHNEQFIERHLHDSIFEHVNGKSLDYEQRRAILCDAKSNLIIAGAGSGKTLTLCGKVKYLLETQNVSPKDILLLSYSRASANDLKEKISNISADLTVETFHSLGLKILTETEQKKKTIEEQLTSYIATFFNDQAINDPETASAIFNYLSLYFYAAPVYHNKYKNDGEIFAELKNSGYKTLKDRLRKFPQKGPHETLKKELVKSYEELVIANYLFVNGINYEYERPYEFETSTLEKRQYTPDFYLTDYGIYLEHYGIDRDGTTPQYDEKASEQYIASMNWKRKTHSENKTICIESYSYEFQEGTLFANLKERLQENGVKFRLLESMEISNMLHNVYTDRDFSSFFKLISTFLSLYKSQEKDETGFYKLKSTLNDTLYDNTRTCLFLNICKEIYNYYIYHLRKYDKIDFDDMILQSIDLLDTAPGFKYKYIIVDEFQDISHSRTKFLQKLIIHGNSKLFAVGDDWQSIYRFAGCDINIFLEFEKIFKGAKLNYITSTHRNSAELQEILEPFITANPSQFKKHIKSDKHQSNPVRIVYHNSNKIYAFTKALADIYKIQPNADVLVLGRNKYDADPLNCKEIKVLDYKTIKHKSYPTLNLSYSTVHASKGLESNFVILINGENAINGFPNKLEDDNILNLLLGTKDNFEYAEERRLFYVALTRTRSIVYLLSEKNKSSIFIKEIKDKCFILENDTEDKGMTDELLCPWCKSGHLVIRKNETKEKSFLGCSNFPYCTYTNDDLINPFFNMRCPKCDDFLVKKTGKCGLFLGCHNYPRCNYTKKYNSEK